MSVLHEVGVHREVPCVAGHGGRVWVWNRWVWGGNGWGLGWGCWSALSLLPCDLQDPFLSKVIPFSREKAGPEGTMNLLLLIIQDSVKTWDCLLKKTSNGLVCLCNSQEPSVSVRGFVPFVS